MAEVIKGEISGRGEKERLRRLDFAFFPGLANAHKSFLDDIVDILVGGKPALEPRAQSGGVRLDFGVKPSRLIRELTFGVHRLLVRAGRNGCKPIDAAKINHVPEATRKAR